MKLIPNWRKALRMFSVQAQLAAAAVLATWQGLDADLRAAVPTWAVVSLVFFLLGAGVVGRLIDQPKVRDE